MKIAIKKLVLAPVTLICLLVVLVLGSQTLAPGRQSASPPAADFSLIQNKTAVKVERVIDGDTIELEDGRKVRYIGIDSPELTSPDKTIECYAQEAADKNKALVSDQKVRLEKDVSETDKYGRLLRYVWLGDILVNNYLVRNGYAQAASFPPDIKYQEQFLEAQKEARENNRGLWSSCPKTTTPE